MDENKNSPEALEEVNNLKPEEYEEDGIEEEGEEDDEEEEEFDDENQQRQLNELESSRTPITTTHSNVTPLETLVLPENDLQSDLITSTHLLSGTTSIFIFTPITFHIYIYAKFDEFDLTEVPVEYTLQPHHDSAEFKVRTSLFLSFFFFSFFFLIIRGFLFRGYFSCSVSVCNS